MFSGIKLFALDKIQVNSCMYFKHATTLKLNSEFIIKLLWKKRKIKAWTGVSSWAYQL
jgi:hypothetical protein